MKKKILPLLSAMLIFSIVLSNIAFAGSWSQYSRTDITNHGYRGLKGYFELHTIDAQYSTSHPYNFITFEQWLTVNAAPDWFEIGFMDGALDPENDGTTVDYRGFYKAKSINGQYWEDKLVKSYTIGSSYTFTIVDVNAANLWEIYIGSTYFGSFADRVNPVDADYNYQGYEVNVEPGSSQPILNDTQITNQYFYGRDVTDIDGDGNTTEYLWKKWNSTTVYTDNSNAWDLTAVYSSATNTTTIDYAP
jgi:hypothetical protein